jgi:hypothetical protein
MIKELIMKKIEEIAQIMQSKGYCEKSSYQWICYVFASMTNLDMVEEVKKIAESQTFNS